MSAALRVTVPWDAFLASRRARRAAALAAAAALRAGDAAPARALLAGWGFADDPALLDPFLARLADAPLAPDGRALAAALADDDVLPPPPPGERLAAEWWHRARLAERAPPRAGDAAEPLAWALAELAFVGGEIERLERRAWAEEPWTVEPKRDARAAKLWTAWLSGNPWAVADAVEVVLLPAVHRAFRGAMERFNVPPEARPGVLDSAREQLLVMLMKPKDGLPGMLDIATRVIETGRPAPIPALGRHVPAPGWDTAAACLAGRGEWAATVRAAWPTRPDAPARAVALGRRLAADPAWLDRFADLHVARRLVAHWSSPAGTSPDACWAVVTQNRGRVRARLRALIGRVPGPELLGGLLALDGLHARTVAATGRFAWDWARQELAHRYAMGADRGVTADCAGPRAPVAPLSPEEAGVVRTWVLKVCLRAFGRHLVAWVRDGGTGDGDATWGRLLMELPDALRFDPAPATTRYVRLRAHLADELLTYLELARPLVAEIAALPAGRGAPERFARAVEGRWDPAIPPVKAGFPSIQRTVADTLAWIDDLLDHPEDP